MFPLYPLLEALFLSVSVLNLDCSRFAERKVVEQSNKVQLHLCGPDISNEENMSLCEEELKDVPLSYVQNSPLLQKKFKKNSQVSG